mmetsp:Transcript_14084/g.46153  ORF Transcript_14084/g.46153 Transcript_14084/m.46153 type:complete len:204 (-) Transcript_14084:295-906(-)
MGLPSPGRDGSLRCRYVQPLLPPVAHGRVPGRVSGRARGTVASRCLQRFRMHGHSHGVRRRRPPEQDPGSGAHARPRRAFRSSLVFTRPLSLSLASLLLSSPPLSSHSHLLLILSCPPGPPPPVAIGGSPGGPSSLALLYLVPCLRARAVQSALLRGSSLSNPISRPPSPPSAFLPPAPPSDEHGCNTGLWLCLADRPGHIRR